MKIIKRIKCMVSGHKYTSVEVSPHEITKLRCSYCDRVYKPSWRSDYYG